jgi:CarD family transcriptional regulator
MSLTRSSSGGFDLGLFEIGDKVVYPHHGAAVIERVEERDLLGEMREYYILKLAYGELTLMVPTDSTEDVGLREVTPAKEMPKVFKVLKKNEPTTNTTNWSRRFKANVEKLKSGDIYQVADVVRSLHQRDKEKGLSAGEKRMLNKARQILVSELTFSKNCNEEEAEALLDEVLG